MSTQHLTLIGTLSKGSSSVALAVNDSGKVVGSSLTPAPPGIADAYSQHAFAFQDLNHNGVVDAGELIDLDPGDVTSGATAVNSSGTAVGYYGGLDFVNSSFESRHFRKRQPDGPEHPGAGRHRRLDTASGIRHQRRRPDRRHYAGPDRSGSRLSAGSDCAEKALDSGAGSIRDRACPPLSLNARDTPAAQARSRVYWKPCRAAGGRGQADFYGRGRIRSGNQRAHHVPDEDALTG